MVSVTIKDIYKSQCDCVYVFASNSYFKIICRGKKLMVSGLWIPAESICCVSHLWSVIICNIPGDRGVCANVYFGCVMKSISSNLVNI